MSIVVDMPSSKNLQRAPERAILHCLAVTARCAELTLLHEFPPRCPDDDIEPVPCRLAAELLLRTLASLRDAVILYDSTVTASEHLTDCGHDLPF